jgi:hypothetical protein
LKAALGTGYVSRGGKSKKEMPVMSKKTILMIALASFILASFETLAVAQADGQRHHLTPSAQATQDPDNTPISKEPDPQVGKMLDEMHRSSNGEAVPSSNGPGDKSGYVGGRPFFSNNPNDQPK